MVGWLLIYTAAALGVQRDAQRWLPLNPVAQVSADYSADSTESFKLAPLDLEIIEDIKQDVSHENESGVSASTLAVAVPAVTATPTSVPTATSIPQPNRLVIDIGGPYYGDEGSSIPLSGSLGSLLRWLPGTIIYNWDLDGDGLYDEAQGRRTSVVFYDEGEYPVALQATDLFGRTVTETTTVHVNNVPPVVSVGPDIFADESQEVDFHAAASDPGRDILLYEWNFGDGNSSVNNLLEPRHIYEDDGIYTVQVRVRDNDGGIAEDTLIVRVANLPPSVDAGPDRTIDEGQPITLTGAAADPSVRDTLTYWWDLNYNGQSFTPDVAGQSVSVTYEDGPANIVAALLVQDDDEGQTLETVNITVNNLAPTIIDVSNGGPVGEGSPLTIIVEAADVISDALTYAFDWNDDGEFDSAGQTGIVSNIWYNQGNFPIGIRIDDGDGGQVYTTTMVSTYNVPPIAIVNADTVRFEGDLVPFDASESSDAGINDVLTYTWRFGDGSSAAGLNPTHVYADNGVYTTTLTVMDDTNASATASVAVQILNANPVANAGADRVVDEGVRLELVGMATDPGGADLLTYSWDFAYDGVTFDEEATGSSAHVTYFDGPAEINVALRVRDDDYNPSPSAGSQIGESVDVLKVMVENVPPWNVNITSPSDDPYYTTVDVPVNLSGTGTDVAFDALTFSWDFNYRDLNFTEDAVGQVISHTWQSSGDYQVALRVYDSDNDYTQSTRTVSVGGPPVAVAEITPATIVEGQSALLDGSGSSDPDDDRLSYTWHFGDGSPTSSGITATHVYPTSGVFTATLQVEDGRGGISTDLAAVLVEDVPPAAVITAAPNPADEGELVYFDGSGSVAGPYDTLVYEWNFGDGTPPLGGVSASHLYPDNGVYTATLTVTDDDGSEAVALAAITILNALPTADAGPDQLVQEGETVNFDGTASSDPGGGALVLYEWDFDYDGVTFSVDSTGLNVSTSYPDGPALYTVALRVTDEDGGVSTLDSIQVTVENLPPTADSGGPYVGAVDTPVTLTGSGDDVSADTLSYAWALNDDLTFDQSGQTVTYTWRVSGTHTVVLQVSDEDGGVTTSTTTVQVNSLAPVAWLGTIYLLFSRRKLKYSRRKSASVGSKGNLRKEEM